MPKIKEVMTRKVITLSEESSLLKASKVLLSKKISGAPVVNKEKHVIGVLTESDVLRALKRQLKGLEESERLDRKYKEVDKSSLIRDALSFVSLDWLWYRWNMRTVDRIFRALQESNTLSQVTVKHSMTLQVLSVGQADSVEKALRLMNAHDINRLPVIDSKKRLVGIVARADLLKAVSEEMSRSEC